ncbi:SURF1 family protein [Arthrobacter sp. Sa2BUA2]|uniref:SURF1-like protein n=1 Tax=Arthrobacter pullicola TaxID=2762224 RepID=A0ABR8YJE6_9MICC|nr:SURF1 family protein [Arthrobacter pullicola]MBD8044064.1 SURF1 family protein [Arthrobacter pullicola]
MLKTALQPRWIAGLILALAISTVFVLLSEWQFSSAENEGAPPAATTEEVRPLTEVFTPGEPLFATQADQMVTFTGSFQPEDQVLVQNRLQDGEEGYWVVTAFAVDGAPGDTLIPVVRGWTEDPSNAGTAPEGDVEITGRLLPPEAPVAGPQPEGTVAALSSAELANIWDEPLYSAFVTAHETQAAGQQDSANELETVVTGPQPQEKSVNWLNIFYAVEWFVFAGFAVFLWWRLLADSYQRSLEDEDDDYEDEYDDDDDDETGREQPPGPTSSEVEK